jgi:hypothetical protein
MKDYEHARKLYFRDLKTATISDVKVEFVIDKGQRYNLIAFSGRKGKPDLYYSYATLGQAVDRLTNYCEGLREAQLVKAEHKARRNAPNQLVKGTILSGSWGYEQTNQEFCEVLEVKGQRVIIRELEQQLVGSNGEQSMSGYTMPVLGKYRGKEKTCVVQYGTNVKWNSSCTLSPWNGKKQFSSWYG